jgi:fermentation-respiration switch protein FrsA (DUF1100 family)
LLLGPSGPAEAAWEYVTETRGEPASRVVLFGRSIGGALAIEAAYRHAPGALIVESTFTSMVDMGRQEYPLLPVSWLCRHRYESIRKVPHMRCPKLFLHGERDELIPLAMARRLFEAAAGPKDFLSTAGGHNDAGFEYSDATTHAVAEWLTEALAGRPRANEHRESERAAPASARGCSETGARLRFAFRFAVRSAVRAALHFAVRAAAPNRAPPYRADSLRGR